MFFVSDITKLHGKMKRKEGKVVICNEWYKKQINGDGVLELMAR